MRHLAFLLLLLLPSCFTSQEVVDQLTANHAGMVAHFDRMVAKHRVLEAKAAAAGNAAAALVIAAEVREEEIPFHQIARIQLGLYSAITGEAYEAFVAQTTNTTLTLIQALENR